MQSWIISSHYSSLQCHVFLQKSFKFTDLMLKKHLVVLLFTFLWKLIKKIIQDSFQKHLFEIEILGIIIKAFTVTFDQFNVYFLNKIISFKKL